MSDGMSDGYRAEQEFKENQKVQAKYLTEEKEKELTVEIDAVLAKLKNLHAGLKNIPVSVDDGAGVFDDMICSVRHARENITALQTEISHVGILRKNEERREELIAQGFDAKVKSYGISLSCSGCSASFIQGVAAHEHGCPNQKKAVKEQHEDDGSG